MATGLRQTLRRMAPLLCQTTRPISYIAFRKLPAVPSKPVLAQVTISKRTAAEWTSDSILERIFYVIKTYEKIDADKVHLDADLVKDLGLDSLDIVEVCYHIERSMDTWISDDERETVELVRDIWEIVMHKLLYNMA